MTYFEQIPHPALRRYIQSFWYCSGDELTNQVHTIPLLQHELVFNFCDYYEIGVKGDGILKNPTAWVSGLQTKPTISRSKGKHEMLGVLFKFNGLRAFTKCNSREFSNIHTDAYFVFGKSLPNLLEEIYGANNSKRKIAILEHYLLKNLQDLQYPAHLKNCLELFSLTKERKISIKETCKQASITNKSLINSFHKFIGVSPGKYLQLQSINTAISLLSKNPKQSLTKLGYDLSFFDQSHFIHAFKSVTGRLPSEYANAVINKKVDKYSPNFIFIEG